MGKGERERESFVLKRSAEISYAFNISQYVAPQKDAEYTQPDVSHSVLNITSGRNMTYCTQNKQQF